MKLLKWFEQRKAQRKVQNLRTKVKLAIDVNISDSQKSIDQFTEMFVDFTNHNYTKHDSFFNLCIFSDVVEIDLTLLVEKFRFAERKQEKKLYARVMAIVILDYLDSVGVLIGNNCLAELKRNNMFEFIDEFKLIHKNFSDFKKQNERLLREIRNNTIAHKSKDALKLSQQINDLNEEEIYDFAIQFKLYIEQFVKLSTKVINYITKYMSEGRIL